MLNRKSVDRISLYIEGDWVKVLVGDPIDIDDGIYVGDEGSAVVYGGCLVAAWSGISHIIPHGTPKNWKKIANRPTHIDNLVAHITMDSLKAAAKKEHLVWEEDCMPRLSRLLELVSSQIEPVHMCMIACNQLRTEIKEGRI